MLIIIIQRFKFIPIALYLFHLRERLLMFFSDCSMLAVKVNIKSKYVIEIFKVEKNIYTLELHSFI